MRSSSNSETRRNSGDIDVVEEVVPLVAGFGKWQFLMAGMLCFSVIPITWNYHAILFLAPSQQGYVCKYPEGLGFENWRLDDWITLSHPKHKVYSKESPNLEQCHMYKLNYSELVNATESEIDSLPTNQSEIIRCSEFLFFPARYGLTILQKLNLLCEDKSKMVLTEALFRIGLMLGNFIFGRMSDRFGRRLILLSSLICQPVAGTFTALSPTFTVYCVARFAFGFSLGGCVNMSFILGEISSLYGIHTLWLKSKGKAPKAVGGQKVYREAEENFLVAHAISMSTYDFPITPFDLRCVVKAYLNQTGRTASIFSYQLPSTGLS